MKRDYFKLLTGQNKKDVFGFSPIDDSIDRIFKASQTRYKLRLLGKGEREVWITEEERYVNFHILGAPGEGKSKFLEYEIRQDIDNGNGLCLLDPSDKGDTVKSVLDYCASIGYEKVILIDPSLSKEYGRIPCIAPLNPKSVDRSVDGVMEALEILFKADYAAMRRVRRYLSALLRVLARQGLTLNETQYFSDYHLDVQQRQAILKGDRDSHTIRNLFRSEYKFDTHFSSTVNILDVLWREPLKSILGNKEGIDFLRAVGDGWVILVNLSSYAMTDEQAELLGVIIISQIIQAVDVLVNSRRNTWKGRFYLYIDEAGFFATPQIKYILQKKRKSGLVMYLAHHDYLQFKGKEEVLSAIEGSARIKLMFNTPGHDDRMRMIKALGYGGNIPPSLASYANSDLPKQYAVIKKNKEAPVRIRIPNVEPVPQASKEYIDKILSQSFYKDVREYVPSRPQAENIKPAQSRTKNDRKADSKPRLSNGKNNFDKWKDVS